MNEVGYIEIVWDEVDEVDVLGRLNSPPCVRLLGQWTFRPAFQVKILANFLFETSLVYLAVGFYCWKRSFGRILKRLIVLL